MTQPIYKIQLYKLEPITGDYILKTEIDEFDNLSINLKSNEPSSVIFNINSYHPQATENNLEIFSTIVSIKRDDVIIFAGYIYKKTLSYSPDFSTIMVECFDMLHRLRKNVLTEIKQYDDEKGNIAWDLINTAQTKTSNNLNILQGTIETTSTSQRNFEKFSVIGDLIQNLAFVQNGIDFEFRPVSDGGGFLDRVDFHVWQNRGKAINTFTLNFTDYIEMFNAVDDVEIYNSVIGLGAGSGEDRIVSDTQQDTGLFSIFGQLETVNAYRNILLKSTLNERAQNDLNNNKVTQKRLALTLKPNTLASQYDIFGLEDVLSYDFTDADNSYTQSIGKGTCRVKEINISFNNGTEKITPIINLI